MNLLATLRASDVDTTAPRIEYAGFRVRPAVRIVLFDHEKVALLHVGKHGYYMLPGGGTDGEELYAAIERELLEELGCTAKVNREVGTIITYIERWRNKQIDTCFVAHIVKYGSTTKPTDFEREEAHHITWASSLTAAIALSENNVPENTDGQLIRLRDLIFMRAVRDVAPLAALEHNATNSSS